MTLPDLKDKVIDLWDRLNPKVKIGLFVVYSIILIAMQYMGKAPKFGLVVAYTKTYKGTRIGRRPITSTMNKKKKASFKKYRGQGR